MNTIWLPVTGYEGRYEVSAHGDIRASDGRVLTGKNRNGYLAVQLYRDGIGRMESIHTIVLTAFVGTRPNGAQACHNNGNPLDNRAWNLRWDTPAGNARDRARHGTATNRRNGHYNSKLTAAQVEEIKSDKRISRLVAADYGVSSSLIRNIRCGIAK